MPQALFEAVDIRNVHRVTKIVINQSLNLVLAPMQTVMQVK